MDRDEVCLEENHHFVGATGTFDKDWNIVSTRSDRLPSGIDPQWHLRKDSLATIAQSTCNIAVKYGSGGYANGTAFFVGPTTLLTAGHMHDGPDTEIVAQLPGVRNTELDLRKLFAENPTVAVFKCSAVEAHKPIADVLLLDSSPNFRATTWVPLERKFINGGIDVDLIGYPGLYGPKYLVETQGETANSKQAISDISQLLPSCELTVSYGPVMRSNTRAPMLMSYKVSTIGGMSGSPVVLNGKAIGVHIGCGREANNRCVTFMADDVWRYLRASAVAVEDNTLGQVDLGPNVYPDSSRGHTGPLRQPY